MATIDGIAYAELKNRYPLEEIIALSNQANFSETQLLSKLMELRSSLDLNKHSFSGFVFRPLIGVVTTISPNGDVEYIEYDAEGRVINVLDSERNYKKRFKYNIIAS